MSALLTPELVEAFIEAARRGVPFETTCEILDVPEATAYSWMRDADRDQRSNGRGVSEQRKTLAVSLVTGIRRARAEAEAEAIEKLRSWRSKDGVDDWRQHAWYLSHGPARSRWYEHKAGSEQAPRVLDAAYAEARELSVDELEQRLMDAGVDDPALPARREAEDARTREDASPLGGAGPMRG